MDQKLNQDWILSEDVKKELMRVVKWAKLIAIIGFVICGLIFIFIVIVGVVLIAYSIFGQDNSALSETKPWITTPVYLLITALCFVPCLMLYNFSVKTEEAIKYRSDDALVKAFSSLYKCFRFVGIITLTIIGLYAIIRIGMLIANLSAMLFG
jgi:hypothetical protein